MSSSPAPLRPAATFFVSPQGHDRAAGTRRAPWRTLAGARDAVRRARLRGLAGPVEIRLLPGDYVLSETLQLGPADSHLWFRAERAGTAQVSGGRRLQGWRVERENGRTLWRLPLPDEASRDPFRSIFVNGVRRPRARWPKFSPTPEGVAAVARLGEIRQNTDSPLQPGDHRFKLRPADDRDWASLPDAEFVILHYWCDARLPQPVRDPRTGWISCARRSNLRLLEAWGAEPARYYLDNLAEALTEPGEWYFDRATAELRYLPRPGETPANTDAIAAQLHTLVDVRGETFVESKETARAETTRLVRDVRFDGIEFAFSDWLQPAPQSFAHDRVDAGGVPAAGSPQAASSVPGTVRFRHAHDCAVTRCRFRHLGHYAVEFGRGCWDSRIRHCAIEDIGAGGVKVDGVDLDGGAADRTGNIEIADNTIHAIGRIFHQGVGVLVTLAQACTIVRNHIHDTLYTAISVGWSWGYRPTISRDHLIADNHLHDIGHGLLSDMGAVYLLGVQPGTVVRHNRIHHVRAHNYGAWGLYLDEGASHIVVERNLVHDTQGACLNIHYGRENLIRHNVLVRGGEALVCLGKVETHVAATLHGNVLIGPTRQLFVGGYAGDIAARDVGLASDGNLLDAIAARLLVAGNPPYRAPQVPTKLSLAAWRATGRDRRSEARAVRVREARGWSFAGDEKLGVPPLNWSDCRPKN